MNTTHMVKRNTIWILLLAWIGKGICDERGYCYGEYS